MPTLERKPLTEPPHIFLDEQGVPWIDHTNVKVVEVAIDSTVLGMTPEQIHGTYSGLTLAQIHAALAYYHDHKGDLDEEIAAREARAERLQASATNPLSRTELEARLRAKAASHDA